MYDAVFLDRDGTLIQDPGYLSDPAGVVLIPGVAEAVHALNEAGIPAILVTNQSGIGRGYYSEVDFRAVQAELDRHLAAHGARLQPGWVACPVGGLSRWTAHHQDRQSEEGLAVQ